MAAETRPATLLPDPPLDHKTSQKFHSTMLRVIVESAKGLPKKKLGNPDPITTIVFRGGFE